MDRADLRVDLPVDLRGDLRVGLRPGDVRRPSPTAWFAPGVSSVMNSLRIHT